VSRRLPRSIALGSVVSLLVLAFVVRIATLTTQSAWLDEGYTMALARHNLGYVIHFTALYDQHPPLYYALLHLWLQAVGFGVLQGRLLSLLCGVGGVIALYVVAATIFDRATALYAAVLLALSPIATWYSDEIRMYAMAGFFAQAALAFLVRALRDDSWSLWAGFAVAAAAAFYTDYSAVYILIGAGLYALLIGFGRRTWRRFLVSAAAAIVLVLPGLPMLYGQIRNNSAAVAWIPAPSPSVVGGSLLDLVSLHPAAPVLISLLGAGMALLGALALRRDLGPGRGPKRLTRARHAYLFLACVILAPLVTPILLSLTHHPAFLTRTVMMATYGLVILFARGVVVVLRRRGLWGLLLFLPLLAANGASLHAAAATSINEDWRGAAAYLRGQVLPGDAVLFDPGYLQSPFDLYWHGGGVPTVQHGYPYDESLLTARPALLNTDARLDTATAGAHTVWILRRDGSGDSSPSDTLGVWARRWMTLVGVTHFNDVSIYRYTRLRVAGLPDAAAWLNATSVVLRHLTPHELVLRRGGGDTAFDQVWAAYPHVQARLMSADSLGPNALAAAVHGDTNTVVLVSRLEGHMDPAGIVGKWLYHNGRQVGAYRPIGDLRLYTFALRGSGR